ncbi:MAG TPA: hypothetical protein VFX00_12705 [Pedococcus sp.]|nr:hypothetical protein [Pedococcus sp.]
MSGGVVSPPEADRQALTPAPDGAPEGRLTWRHAVRALSAPLPMGRVERALGRVAQRVVGVVLLLTGLVALVAPRSPNIRYTAWAMVVAALVLVGLVISASVLRRRLRRPVGRALWLARALAWWVAVPLSLAGGGLGVWLGYHVRYTYGWDAAAMTRYSLWLALFGEPRPVMLDYFSRYPNNLPLLALTNLGRTVSDSSPGFPDAYVTFIWLNGVCVAAVLLLTFVLATMLRGRLAGLAALLLTTVLVAANPWTAVPYTDLTAMPFIVGGVTAAVGGLRLRTHVLRVLLFAVAGFSLGVAYVIKTTPAAIAVGVGLVLVVLLLRRPRAVVLAVVAACLVAGGLGFLGGTRTALAQTDALSGVDRASLDLTRTPPPAWWVAMGLTERFTLDNRSMYGVYNPDMVRESRGLSGIALHEYSSAALQAQLDRLGPLGLARFEVDKQLYNWGDGMFFAWGEGPDADAGKQLDHSPTARAVQEWQQAQGRHYLLRANVTNALWLLLVVVAGLGLVTVPYRRDWFAMALTVLGLALFVLVFQGRSRYIFPAAPLIVALAVSTSPTRRAGPVLARLRQRATTLRHKGEVSADE